MHRSLFLVFSKALGVASYIRDKRGTRCVASNAPSSRERLVSVWIDRFILQQLLVPNNGLKHSSQSVSQVHWVLQRC